MSGPFRENWKRAANRLPSSATDDDSDIVRFSEMNEAIAASGVGPDPSFDSISFDRANEDVVIERSSSNILNVSKSVGGGGDAIVRSSGVRVADGSAANPSVAFKSSPDTGFFAENSANIALSLDGTTRFNFFYAGGS